MSQVLFVFPSLTQHAGLGRNPVSVLSGKYPPILSSRRESDGVMDIEWTFLGSNPTQLTASSSSFQNELAKTVRNRFFVKESVVPHPNPARLHEGLQTLFTEHPNVGLP
jgi:hypothetical protein